MAKKVKEYDEKSIQTFEGVEGIRVRPTVYIEELGKGGVKRLAIEVIGNVLDEFNAGFGKQMDISLDTKTSTIKVRDYARGIPVGKLEAIITKMHTGGKFGAGAYSISTGLNGLGLKAVNALSDKMTVITYRDGYKYKQEYSKGHPITEVEKIKKSSEQGTKVSFHPDEEIFGDISIEPKEYEKMLKLYSCLNPGLHIHYSLDDNPVKEIYSKEGIKDLLKEVKYTSILKSPISIQGTTSIPSEKKNKPNQELGLKVIIDYDKAREEEYVRSFVNGVYTSENGTHVTGLLMGISQFFSKYIETNKMIPLKSRVEIKGEDVKECLLLIVAAQHSDPLFVSQTKNRLSNQNMQTFGKKLILEELAKVDKKTLEPIAKLIIDTARGRMAAKTAKMAVKKIKPSATMGLSKFDKYTSCTSNKPEEKELFILEGQSASGSLVEARDPKTQAIYRLRGKPKNAHDKDINHLMTNAELKDISILLGTGIGKAFDYSKLQFSKIVITNDADIDGAHICALMNDFFLVHFRELVEKGHLYLAKPPLYLIKDGKQKRFISNKQEFEKFMVSKVFDKFKLSIKGETLTKKSLREVFTHFETYLYELKQLSSKYALDQSLFEYICIVYQPGETQKFVQKLLKKYDELKATPLKNGHLLLEGLIGNSYQNIDLDNEEFIDSVKVIKRYYKKYGTAYIQAEAKKMTFGNFLKEANDKALPLGTKIERFKGLGGMESEQLGETTLDPKTRTLERITISSLTQAMETSEKLMGSDPDERKSFLMSFKINPDDIDT